MADSFERTGALAETDGAAALLNSEQASRGKYTGSELISE